MTDHEGTGRPDDSEGEGWREGAPNPTQERIDREGAENRPGDVAWGEDRWGDAETQDAGEAEIGP